MNKNGGKGDYNNEKRRRIHFMAEITLNNTELTILEILSQQRDSHRLNIMAQMIEMAKITGQPFDKALFEKSLLSIEKTGYIKSLEADPDTFVLTSKGKELLG